MKEIEFIMKKPFHRETLCPNVFAGKLYQNFKKKSYTLFQKITEEELNQFYEVSIMLIQKLDKNIKENYSLVFLINQDIKILNKILTNQIQQHD